MVDKNDAAIRVAGARKIFKAPGRPVKVAVDDVSVSVQPASIHGLLGPNGAGKTTTLKMLLGLVRPTAGVFEVLGLDSTRPGGRRALGFLPEQPYFPMNLTAIQAMRFYARLTGVSRKGIDDDSAALLSRVGLEDAARTELSKFSRGMLQRLGIAQALLGNPRVVILDEPASGLDPVGQRDVRNLMLELRSEGVTVLLSSHQLSEVEAVCDRVSILNRGCLAAEGDINTLLNVSGKTSVRVAGLDALPDAVSSLAEDVALTGGMLVFSISTGATRAVVDAIDESGGTIVSVMPKRDSLEDYFSRLLETTAREAVSS
ncbi:MAG: ABC transporter ATP-binding protein [Actinomycetota bacterium]|nr:ABC transporter ATP-binding protein [Actinomycetota bacterium]